MPECVVRGQVGQDSIHFEQQIQAVNRLIETLVEHTTSKSP